MATINISLRTLQRSVDEFTDLLAKNPGLWVNVVGRGGEVLFMAKSMDESDVTPVKSGDKPARIISVDPGLVKAEAFQSLKASLDARATPDRSGRDHDVFGPSLAAEELREDEFPVASQDLCQKCKKPSELYLYEEEGLEYRVCALCAIKAKIPMARMKKL